MRTDRSNTFFGTDSFLNESLVTGSGPVAGRSILKFCTRKFEAVLPVTGYLS